MLDVGRILYLNNSNLHEPDPENPVTRLILKLDRNAWGAFRPITSYYFLPILYLSGSTGSKYGLGYKNKGYRWTQWDLEYWVLSGSNAYYWVTGSQSSAIAPPKWTYQPRRNARPAKTARAHGKITQRA